ncbi:hypothetical protein JHK82_040612 [Glycine max]|uniref:Uncharacterized protein n=2 Tax=Glycine subgen. Soja TaxID=1462606 RepID=A0A0R0GT10_SOYBN|nr:hypothetical protein JHK87_040636 [Glycine soja]KAG4966434.1 hypothetical protein JHK85_041409 [Glycine max]KAG5111389.1 hypothetical protein JHK82_040612 [Glycine max]KAG5122678.1 hypothetical protein JHK84_041018 [Glycine max]KAH1095429.1 hypothetical protein GYH30_040635 [Glycine max]
MKNCLKNNPENFFGFFSASSVWPCFSSTPLFLPEHQLLLQAQTHSIHCHPRSLMVHGHEEFLDKLI